MKVDLIPNLHLINISNRIQGSRIRSSLRTKCGDSFTFCIAQKVTKMLVALKTRFVLFTFAWCGYLLSRFFAFHFLFLDVDSSHESCLLPETNHPRGSDNLERQILPDSK